MTKVQLTAAGQVLLLLASAVAGCAQETESKPKQAETASETKEAHQDAPANELVSITHHKMTLRGQALSYTATATRMVIKDDAGKPQARMFYVAYTLDNAKPGKRPLTFAFNGGPGSATVWLHMGCFGPKRVKLLPNGFMPAPPFELEDNADSILDKTDLVFIDAIGTGYSRAETPALRKQYSSLKGDLAAFGECIRLYLQKNSRWTSPIFLAGESYGTTRAAGLSGYLVDRGIALNGVILISTILNFETAGFAPGNDLPYILYLPTYAMTAAYHKKLPAEITKNLADFRADAEKFAATEYTAALQAGDVLPADQRHAVAEKLAHFTGLSAQYIEHQNLRVDLSHFNTELLRDQDKTVGRLDQRFTGVSASATEQTPEFDPSEAAIRPPYTSNFGDYVKTELNYTTDLMYYVLGGGIDAWDYNVNGWSGFADTSQALRHAFAKNPTLHVYVAEGLYDAATPYFAAEYTFNHMGLNAAAHQNLTRSQFAAGHMVYIDVTSMHKLKNEVDHFYDSSIAH